MAPQSHHRSIRTTLLVAVVALAAIAGCGDDDDGASRNQRDRRDRTTVTNRGFFGGGSTTTTSTVPGEEPEAAENPDLGIYCAYANAFAVLFPPDPVELLNALADVYVPPPPDQASRAKPPPAPIADQVNAVIFALTVVAQSGDRAAIADPAIVAAVEQISQFNDATCT